MSDTGHPPPEKKQRISPDESPMLIIDNAIPPHPLSNLTVELQQDPECPCVLDLPSTQTSMEIPTSLLVESEVLSLRSSVMTVDLQPDSVDLPSIIDLPPSRTPPEKLSHLDSADPSHQIDELESQVPLLPGAPSQNSNIPLTPVTQALAHRTLQPNDSVMQSVLPLTQLATQHAARSAHVTLPIATRVPFHHDPEPNTCTASQLVPLPTTSLALKYVEFHANVELMRLKAYVDPPADGHSSTELLMAVSDVARRHFSQPDVAEAWKKVCKARLKWIIHDVTPAFDFNAVECYAAASAEASRVWEMEKENLRKIEDSERRAAALGLLMGKNEDDVLKFKVAAGVEAEKRLAESVDVKEQVKKAKIAAEARSAALGKEEVLVAAVLSRQPRPLCIIRLVEHTYRLVQFAERVKQGVNKQIEARRTLLLKANLLSHDENKKVTGRKNARLDDVKQSAYKYALEQLLVTV